MNNSKAVSVLFGLIVGIISTLTALLLGVSEGISLLTAAIISFSSSTLLFAIITENLFDKKISEIYSSFEKIRNKDFETVVLFECKIFWKKEFTNWVPKLCKRNFEQVNFQLFHRYM